jgi:hypothetical protein
VAEDRTLLLFPVIVALAAVLAAGALVIAGQTMLSLAA